MWKGLWMTVPLLPNSWTSSLFPSLFAHYYIHTYIYIIAQLNKPVTQWSTMQRLRGKTIHTCCMQRSWWPEKQYIITASATFKDLRLNDRKAKQCISTALSQLFTVHVLLPTVKAISISLRQQWSAKQRLRDSIDIERCWMDGWVAFTVTVDGWFNSGPVWGKKKQDRPYFGVFLFLCVHQCMCEWDNLVRWQALSQAYRQTLSLPPTFHHLSLWHAQKCHELEPSADCERESVLVFVCLFHPSNPALQCCLYSGHSTMNWYIHKNYVEYNDYAHNTRVSARKGAWLWWSYKFIVYRSTFSLLFSNVT